MSVIKPGIPCRQCDAAVLFRPPGSDYVECGLCGHLLTEAEYMAWLQHLAEFEKQKRKDTA